MQFVISFPLLFAKASTLALGSTQSTAMGMGRVTRAISPGLKGRELKIRLYLVS